MLRVRSISTNSPEIFRSRGRLKDTEELRQGDEDAAEDDLIASMRDEAPFGERAGDAGDLHVFEVPPMLGVRSVSTNSPEVLRSPPAAQGQQEVRPGDTQEVEGECMRQESGLAPLPSTHTPGSATQFRSPLSKLASPASGGEASGSSSLTDSTLAEGTLTPRTYEAMQQQAVGRVMLRMSASSGGSTTWLDRLDRVRRGHHLARRSTVRGHAAAQQGVPSKTGGLRRRLSSTASTCARVSLEMSQSVRTTAKGSVSKTISAVRRDRGPGPLGRRGREFIALHPGGEPECVQLDEEESKIHFEIRSKRNVKLELTIASAALVILIGVTLGCISASITLGESQIFQGKKERIAAAMWPCSQDGGRCTDADEPHRAAAFFTYLGINLGLVACAAMLCFFAPHATASGLPQVKAFLNGCRIPGLLRLTTLVAKVFGITMVVATALPLGREGPMVHIGSIVASLFSRFERGPLRDLVELRLPKQQRTWIGVGAATGIA